MNLSHNKLQQIIANSAANNLCDTHNLLLPIAVVVAVVITVAIGIIVAVAVASTLSLFDFIACLSLELFLPVRWFVLGRFGQ